MPIIREENNEKQDATIVIPYVAGLREAIKRTYNKFNITVTFRSNTLKLTLKDLPPTKQQSNVVYQVPCDCGLVYINVDLKPNLKNRKMQPQLGYTNKHSWNMLGNAIIALTGTIWVRLTERTSSYIMYSATPNRHNNE